MLGVALQRILRKIKNIYLLIKSYGPLRLAYNYNFRVVCKAARALDLLTNCSVLKV
jgi:hypothetical protein